MRFNLTKFTPDPAPQPAPAKDKVSEVANYVVSKASLLEEVRLMPENGYAVLITMTPDEDGGLMVRGSRHPRNSNALVDEGIDHYAHEFFVRRMNGDLD